jgi:hypothetical protein
MELGGRTVGGGVVAPSDLPRRTVEREELAGAGTDVEVVPRDRGSDEDSASRVEGPGDGIGWRSSIDGERQDDQAADQSRREDHAPFYGAVPAAVQDAAFSGRPSRDEERPSV